jgi:hypothetical protein
VKKLQASGGQVGQVTGWMCCGIHCITAGWFPILEKKIKESGNLAPQKYRVIQRKEPSHFLNLINRAMVIHK